MDLFSENLDLVAKIVNKFYYGQVDKDDLMQAGLMGLHAAVRNFNPEYSVKFNTYATYYILGEIKKEMRKQNPISLNKKMYRIIRYLKDNQNKSVEEIATELKISKDDVLLAYLYQPKVLSLNQSVKESENSELLDFVIGYERKNRIADALDSLTKEDRELIELRYFQNYSQLEIAKLYGKSQSKISRMESKSLKLMRNILVGK